jgi:hypothetical protein
MLTSAVELGQPQSCTSPEDSTSQNHAIQLKNHLVHLGLQALADGDAARVALVTELLRSWRLRHV